MRITKQTIKKLDEMCFDIDFCNDDEIRTTPEKATKFLITGWTESGNFINRMVKAPKTLEVTIEWLEQRVFVERKAVMVDLYQYLKPIFGNQAYSYGVGVDTIWKAEEKIQAVRLKLQELGLKYREENSFGGFTYKFIISKAKENIEILKKAIA